MSSIWILGYFSLKLNQFDLPYFKEINMIGWRYFSRFLKLCLFGFLISFSTVFANSVNANLISVWSSYIPSPYFSNYDITVLKRWKFLSNYIWQAKPMLALAQYTFLFWNNWMLYYYDYWKYCDTKWDLIQWYFLNYQICDEMTTEWNVMVNCSNPAVYDTELVWRFLQNVDTSDLFYYNRIAWWDSYCRTSSNWGTYCFNSHNLWKSLCFTFSKPWYQALQWLTWSLDLPSEQWFWVNIWLLDNPPLYQYDSSPVDSWNVVEIPPELISNQDILDYFQNTHWWDWDMCFVWTFDLSPGYSWDYYRLTWYNIFDAYSILYTWTNVSDPKAIIQGTNTMNVWGWINTIYNNYYTYFVKRLDYIGYEWNPLYYSFRWNNWLYSVNKDSTFYPFDGRSNIEDSLAAKYYNKYRNTDQNWQDIAYYCSAVLSPNWPNEPYDGTW